MGRESLWARRALAVLVMLFIGVVVLIIVLLAIAASPIGGTDLTLTLGLLGVILLLSAVALKLLRVAARLFVGAPPPRRRAFGDQRAPSNSQYDRPSRVEAPSGTEG